MQKFLILSMYESIVQKELGRPRVVALKRTFTHNADSASSHCL